MAIVTAIRQQQKRQDRFSIYIDGRYLFSLAEGELQDSGLKTHDELSPERLVELQEQSVIGKALGRALNYLSFRSRSIKEVRDYLRRKQFDEDTSAAVIERLVVQDFLNDEKFAADWVEQRREIGHSSRLKLKVELQQKGVSNDVIAEVLARLDGDSEVEAVKELIESRGLRRRYPDDQKLIRYLSGKGFSFGTIKTALKQSD